jgi:hypothetical protein
MLRIAIFFTIETLIKLLGNSGLRQTGQALAVSHAEARGAQLADAAHLVKIGLCRI